MNKRVITPLKKWAKKYERCVKCGTAEIMHIAHGYCKHCYERKTEEKFKNLDRVRNYGGSSSLLTKEFLVENYITNGKSLGDIAKEANCSRQYVHKMMLSHGIPERRKNSARIMALDKGKIIRENLSFEGSQRYVKLDRIILNESFFSSWSIGMAYVLGVIFTDGNLSPRGGTCPIDHFTISQKEPELLAKVLALMECNAKIFFRKEHIYNGKKAGALHWFRIANNNVYNDLIKLGLSPNKSLVITFPNVPNRYVRHFIRGCWDGDGSVYIDKQSKRIGASFLTGSLRFMEGMVMALAEAGFPRRKIYINKGKNPSYYIRVTGTQVPNFYNYLYDAVPPTQYLERKFKLFRLSLEMNPEKPSLSSRTS